MSNETLNVDCGLTEEEFAKFTLYFATNNPSDNRKRATVLGFSKPGIKIAPGAIIRLGEHGSVGENVFIGIFSYINGDVEIGDNVLIGPHCSLTSNTHLFNPESESFRGKNTNKCIKIGKGSWLAAGTMVSAGTTIGKCNLICANAVVTKDTPDFAIMAGTPARQVGTVDQASGELLWFRNGRDTVQASSPGSFSPMPSHLESVGGPRSGSPN